MSNVESTKALDKILRENGYEPHHTCGFPNYWHFESGSTKRIGILGYDIPAVRVGLLGCDIPTVTLALAFEVEQEFAEFNHKMGAFVAAIPAWREIMQKILQVEFQKLVEQKD